MGFCQHHTFCLTFLSLSALQTAPAILCYLCGCSSAHAGHVIGGYVCVDKNKHGMVGEGAVGGFRGSLLGLSSSSSCCHRHMHSFQSYIRASA